MGIGPSAEDWAEHDRNAQEAAKAREDGLCCAFCGIPGADYQGLSRRNRYCDAACSSLCNDLPPTERTPTKAEIVAAFRRGGP
jgi:hypothetical protein